MVADSGHLPSGESIPSDADIRVTRELCRAGTLLKMEVLDHVIVVRLRTADTTQPTVQSRSRSASCKEPVDIRPLRTQCEGVTKNLNNAPLTPAVLHILLALSTKERHGYGIMKKVESESRGKVKMGTGTLYGSLGRMMEGGLIRESDKKVDPEMDDERRIYYQITALGQATLEAELERYREVVAVAKSKQLAPGSFAYGF